MRFVTKTIHAWLDYPVALALIALPFLLGLGTSNPLALTISPVVGVAAFLLTVFTDHHLRADSRAAIQAAPRRRSGRRRPVPDLASRVRAFPGSMPRTTG